MRIAVKITLLGVFVLALLSGQQVSPPPGGAGGGAPTGAAGGDLGGTYPNPTVSKVTGAATYGTASNCSSSASPAVCGSAAAGSVVIAASETTVVVNTTAVTANSQILIMFDSSLGTKLGVTCNTTVPALYGITVRTAATSFTIGATAPVTNPACLSFLVIN